MQATSEVVEPNVIRQRVVPHVKLDPRTRIGRRVGELVADFTEALRTTTTRALALPDQAHIAVDDARSRSASKAPALDSLGHGLARLGVVGAGMAAGGSTGFARAMAGMRALSQSFIHGSALALDHLLGLADISRLQRVGVGKLPRLRQVTLPHLQDVVGARRRSVR
jgi:hypothetical protein